MVKRYVEIVLRNILEVSNMDTKYFLNLWNNSKKYYTMEEKITAKVAWLYWKK